jgi:hypothetical protein
MPRRSPSIRPTVPAVPLFSELTASFRRSLAAANKAPRTIQTYTEGLSLYTLSDEEPRAWFSYRRAYLAQKDPDEVFVPDAALARATCKM